MQSLSAFIAQGAVQPAIDHLQQTVRAQPGQIGARFELGEALLLLGAFERADIHFDLISTQDPAFGLRVALVRQLIRGELWRREVFTQGRAPEVIGDIDPACAIGLKILLEQCNGGDAAALRQQADEQAPPIRARVDGRPASVLRDLDDRTADVLEVLTSTGKYFWIPYRRVRSLELHKPAHPRDLIWRAATLEVEDGPEGEVYLPTTYVTDPALLTDELRLGRNTEWIEVGGLSQGLGLRCLLVDEEVLAFGDFTTLEVNEGPST